MMTVKCEMSDRSMEPQVYRAWSPGEACCVKTKGLLWCRGSVIEQVTAFQGRKPYTTVFLQLLCDGANEHSCFFLNDVSTHYNCVCRHLIFLLRNEINKLLVHKHNKNPKITFFLPPSFLSRYLQRLVRSLLYLPFKKSKQCPRHC